MSNTSFKNMLWEVAAPDSQLVQSLANQLSTCMPRASSVAAGLLINRGVTTLEEARGFLEPQLMDLHDPYLLNGMEDAVQRIKKALEKSEKILIYGDYDVDGLTATALLILVLREMGADVRSHVPHRIKEGYGLNEEAISTAYREGVKLIVTVDCGINSIQEVIQASRLGIDTIITDHHELQSLVLPPAIAVLNPHQPGCTYPCVDLSGVGVAFKLAAALCGISNVDKHLDLVALGTVADVVPLSGENRILVKYGLEKLAKTEKTGLRALMQVAGISNGELSTEHVAFMLAPRLNAPGRLDSAEISLKLLLAESESSALDLAYELEKGNRRRQAIQSKILADAHEKVERELEESLCPVIVLADESWHPGIVGIVAGRLVDDYCRPAILIAMDEDNGKGSARSIEQFHILNALKECKDLLAGFGGHSRAAGLLISRENLESFAGKMREIGKEKLAGMNLLPKLKIDMELNLSGITWNLIKEIGCLQPCGSGNAEPNFVSYNVQVMNPRVVKNKHLKMRVKMRVVENSRSVDAIGFGMGSCISELNKGGRVDIVYSPQMNSWGGQNEVQLQLRDIRLTKPHP